MKIKHSLVFVISSLLLGGVGMPVFAQTAAPTAPKPAVAPKETPLSQKERQELQQRREQERIQKAVDNSVKNSSELRNQVQSEVSRSFGFTTSLLNLLLGLLILFPIAGIIALWLLRRNLASQIKTEVKQELGQEVKAELVRSIHAELESNSVGSDVAPNNGENVGQLKEMISMAMATQNLITETRHTIEDSANSQAKAEQLLRDVFERSQQPPSDRLNEGYEPPKKHEQERLNHQDYQPPQEPVEDNFDGYEEATPEPVEEAVTEVVYEPYVQQTNHSNNDVYQRYENTQQVRLEEDDFDDRLLDVTPQYSSNGEVNPQEVIAHCERAIQGNYEDFEAWCAKGVALSQLGRFEEALGALNKSLQFNSEFADAWYEKARCYALQGKTDSALENLRRSIHLNPSKRQMAKSDAFFNAIRQSIGFEEMVAAG